ncbi:hypothetical protein CSB45_07580 [candidate division KSB3 bacterium]|uniref:Haloacid dehalogenase n=1 Tax=candidate division KSB3 bacterium TaxID=2044937 RepID=A0A2G6E603_9BACT|nr:MAG: hypothetical protein CSB45_07580 [candidate division KSB3 bacterium]PIE29896.1 MAG: hypothetical protein CSA57_06285 [candidate division KSB3 bacterium]
MTTGMFITDFDGVVCDSVTECFLVTYNARGKLRNSSFERVREIETLPVEQRQEFRRLRVYLKGAEDFIPLLMSMEQGIDVKDQESFDRFKESLQAELPEFLAAFYAERDFLLQHEKELWLSLNPLFDKVGTAFQERESFENLRVLTTKRQIDACEIFKFQGIDFPEEYILYVKAADKPQRLSELLATYKATCEKSIYVEDQVDFLVASQKQNIASFLTDWGYVSPEQRERAAQNGIPMISQDRYCELLSRF